MPILSVDNVCFSGLVGYHQRRGEHVYEKLKSFSGTFTYGKSFLLDGEIGTGAWALSWIVGALVNPESGSIKLDSRPYTAEERKRATWCVRTSEIRNYIWSDQTVKWQIRHGLKNTRIQHLQSEQDIIEQFGLTPERYGRPFSTLSHEAWRASCAIGLANGRNIFCFPYLPSNFVEENYHLWFETLIKVLKENNCLVLIPTKATKAIMTLCDEIVSTPQT